MILKPLDEAKEFIKKQIDFSPEVAITLGSGLGNFVDHMEVIKAIPFADIPHFVPAKVAGHAGQLVFGQLGPKKLMVLQGRIHFYEGHSMSQVVFPTRLAAHLGVDTLVLTNAAGGLDAKMRPGELMLITDQINLTGTNPLIGPNESSLGPRFVDMTNLYDPGLIQLFEKVMVEQQVNYHKGIYCGVSGPSYETAAEIKMFGQLGGGAVGMSTVAEAIAARHMGLRIAGLSCITNLGTGLSPEKLSHDEVKNTGMKIAKVFSQVLIKAIENF